MFFLLTPGTGTNINQKSFEAVVTNIQGHIKIKSQQYKTQKSDNKNSIQTSKSKTRKTQMTEGLISVNVKNTWTQMNMLRL